MPTQPPKRIVTLDEIPIRPRRRLRVALAALALLAGAFAIPAIGAYYLWSAEPAYWQDRAAFIQSHSDQQLQNIAKSLEQRLTIQPAEPPLAATPKQPAPALTPAPRAQHESEPAPNTEPTPNVYHDDYVIADLLPGEDLRNFPQPEPDTAKNKNPNQPPTNLNPQNHPPRRVHVTMNEINAWMDRRLTAWLRDQGKHLPNQVHNPMLAQQGDQFVLAFRYRNAHVNQVVSLKFDVEFTLQGQAKIKLDEVKGGRLTLPARTLTRHGQNLNIPGARELQRLARAFDGMKLDPVVEIDNEQVRITDMRLSGEGLGIVIIPEDNQSASRR